MTRPLAAPRPSLCSVVSPKEKSYISLHSYSIVGPYDRLLLLQQEQLTWAMLPRRSAKTVCGLLGALHRAGSRDREHVAPRQSHLWLLPATKSCATPASTSECSSRSTQ